MSTWWRVVDMGAMDPQAGGPMFIGHIYPGELHPELLDNLNRRGLKDHNTRVEVITDQSFSAPGISLMDAHHCGMELDGLTVSIAASDFEMLYRHWSESPERLELSRPYYKLYSQHRCLCVEPAQRRALFEWMQKTLPEARAVERAENAELVRRLGKSDRVRLRPSRFDKPPPGDN